METNSTSSSEWVSAFVAFIILFYMDASLQVYMYKGIFDF